MDTLSYKTVSVNKATAQKEWVVIDAEGKVLGRMCSKVAKLLRGKYKPNFTPNVDCGDNVIIINADKVKMTGNKWNDRIYVRYTGFPGGQREMTPAQLLEKGADPGNTNTLGLSWQYICDSMTEDLRGKAQKWHPTFEV